MHGLNRPRLLDLFCGAGGCSVGYHRAGFDVVGVDIRPQPRYPFAFHQGDALEYLAKHGREFDAIHASPPCQRYSQASRIAGNAHTHPDLVPPTRDALIASGRPYVIENVPGAPLYWPVLVCGLALGLAVKRHRLFESNLLLFGTICPAGHRGDYLTVFGHDVRKKLGDIGWLSVYGDGANHQAARHRHRATASEARIAMGIDWMTRDEIAQAIPPAYTEFLGRQLIRTIGGGV